MFFIQNRKLQIVNNDILKNVKVNIYISHKIGIIVEPKEKTVQSNLHRICTVVLFNIELK